MNNIISFIRGQSEQPAKNLGEFISFCKHELHVFGRDLAWDDTFWPGTGCCFGKLSAMSPKGVAYRGYAEKNPLDGDFIGFAKAYMRYQHVNSPGKSNTSTRLRALRLIEAALIKQTQSARVSSVSRVVLDEIYNICTEINYSISTIQSAMSYVTEIAAFIDDYGLASGNIRDWKGPSLKRDVRNQMVGNVGDNYRKSRLVDTEVIQALISIFQKDPSGLTSLDIYVTSVAALLMCQPSRISELSDLRVGCLRDGKDMAGSTYHYLGGYESSKGYGRNKKSIPSAMVSVAATALDRLARLSYEGRRLAEYIETGPGKFYRHAQCPSVPDDQLLSSSQACEALGLATLRANHTFKSWLVANNAYFGTTVGFSLNNLWRIVITNQKIRPDENGFIWQNRAKLIRAKDSLFCMTWGALSERVGTSPVTLHAASAKSIGRMIAHSSSPRRKSIFERHGFTKENGNPLSANSHQFRHWLNTLLQKKGASEEVIAMWSGRKDIKQNRTYNQMMDEEKVARSAGVLFPVTEAIESTNACVPRSREEFIAIQKEYGGTIQHTEFGFCVHDYAATPCQLYSDCGNCAEHFCEKGDELKTKAIKERLANLEIEFSAAAEELSQGTYGADSWYKYHKGTTERFRQLVNILDDPVVKQGALIWLAGGVYSIHGHRAARVAAGKSNGLDPQKTLDAAKYG
jgi:hypothetical protein